MRRFSGLFTRAPKEIKVKVDENTTHTLVMAAHATMLDVLSEISKLEKMELDQAQYSFGCKGVALNMEGQISSLKATDLVLIPYIKRAHEVEKKFFGLALNECVRRLLSNQNGVPLVVVKCIECIEAKGFNAIGILRLSGNKAEVVRLRDQFNELKNLELSSIAVDCHTVAELMKLYFRSLPESVVPVVFHSKFITTMTNVNFTTEDKIMHLRNLVQELPSVQYNVLKYTLDFFYRLSKNSAQNKMTAANISIAMSSEMFFPGRDVVDFNAHSSSFNTALTMLIQNYELCFDKEYATVSLDEPIEDTQVISDGVIITGDSEGDSDDDSEAEYDTETPSSTTTTPRTTTPRDENQQQLLGKPPSGILKKESPRRVNFASPSEEGSESGATKITTITSTTTTSADTTNSNENPQVENEKSTTTTSSSSSNNNSVKLPNIILDLPRAPSGPTTLGKKSQTVKFAEENNQINILPDIGYYSEETPRGTSESTTTTNTASTTNIANRPQTPRNTSPRGEINTKVVSPRTSPRDKSPIDTTPPKAPTTAASKDRKSIALAPKDWESIQETWIKSVEEWRQKCSKLTLDNDTLKRRHQNDLAEQEAEWKARVAEERRRGDDYMNQYEKTKRELELAHEDYTLRIKLLEEEIDGLLLEKSQFQTKFVSLRQEYQQRLVQKGVANDLPLPDDPANNSGTASMRVDHKSVTRNNTQSLSNMLMDLQKYRKSAAMQAHERSETNAPRIEDTLQDLKQFSRDEKTEQILQKSETKEISPNETLLEVKTGITWAPTVQDQIAEEKTERTQAQKEDISVSTGIVWTPTATTSSENNGQISNAPLPDIVEEKQEPPLSNSNPSKEGTTTQASNTPSGDSDKIDLSNIVLDKNDNIEAKPQQQQPQQRMDSAPRSMLINTSSSAVKNVVTTVLADKPTLNSANKLAPVDHSRTCAICQKPIFDSWIVANEQPVHKSCFTCFQCNTMITGAFAIRPDGAMCQPCLENSLKAGPESNVLITTQPVKPKKPSCGRCHEPIEGERISALGSPYHKKCFFCFECDGKFENMKFFNKNGKPVCVTCKKKK